MYFQTDSSPCIYICVISFHLKMLGLRNQHILFKCSPRRKVSHIVCVGVYLAMNFTRGQVNTDNSQVLKEANVSEKR